MFGLPLTLCPLVIILQVSLGGEVRLSQETPCVVGQSCVLRCVLVSGQLTRGFSYAVGATIVVLCNTDGTCTGQIPSDYKYTASATTSQLQILNFQAYDAVNWTCYDGTTDPQSIFRVMQNSLPTGPLTWGSTCVSGNATSPASLSCSLANPGVPPATITMKDSGNQVVNSSETGSVVGTVTAARQASCSVTWSAFPSFPLNISSVLCDVQVAASVTTSIRDVTGGQKVITCQAQGYPDTYTFQPWLQAWDGQGVRRVNGSQVGGQYSLTLTSYQDTGTYTCTVDNGVLDIRGQVIRRSASINVTVEAIPVFPLASNPAIVAGETGDPVRLFRTVFASPALTSHTWYFNSTDATSVIPGARTNISRAMVSLPVHGSTVTTEGSVVSLSLTVSQQFSGLYCLHACNSIGCSSSNVTLQAASAPFPPENLHANSSTDSVVMSWTPGFAGGDFSQWFHVQYRRQDGQEGPWSDVSTADNRSSSDRTPVTVTVQGLQPDTSYVFRVRAQSSRTQRNLSGYSNTTAKTFLEPSSGASIGGIVGGILGAVVAVGVIIVVVCFVLRRRKTARGHDDKPLKKSTAKDAQQGSANAAFSSSPVKENPHSAHPILDDNPLYDSTANDATHGPSTSAPKKKTGSPPPSSAAADVYAVVDKTKKKADDKGKKRDKKKDKKDKTSSKIYENSDGVAVSDKAPEKPGPVREIVGGCEYVSVEIVGKPGEAGRPAPARKPKPSQPDDQYKNDAVLYTVIDHSKRS